MRESEIQSKIIQSLEKRGYLINKIIQSTKNGWPDLEALKNKVATYVEVKIPGEEPDNLQIYRHNQLRQQGFEVIVASSLKDVEHLK